MTSQWVHHGVTSPLLYTQSANDQYQWGNDVQTILPLHCQRSLLQQCFMNVPEADCMLWA
ncbi:hypothetical protein CSPX01_09179 [Colletotrichum filicis]|nr:hypothetical protein CSPX01_09179 [Colletotrichum filicis]